MLTAVTRRMVRFRAVVIGAWIVVALAGLLGSWNISSLLSTSLSVPHTQSARADATLRQHFNENVEGSFTVIVPYGHRDARQVANLLERVTTATAQLGEAHVTQHQAIGGVLYVMVETPWNLAVAANHTTDFRHDLETAGLARVMVTGPPALQSDITPVLQHDLRRGELLAAVVALVLMLALLGLCWAVLIPFVVAGATTMASVGVVFLLAHHFLMVLYVPNVIELIGLGLAIDYSLLMVHRFRHEVRAGHATVDEAIVATMHTSGRTILFSGVAVGLGLTTLFFVPVPFVRSLGFAGLVVPLVAILAAVTLQPALLSVVGESGVRPWRVAGLLWRREPLSGAWARITRSVVKHPRRVVAVTLMALLALSSLNLWLTLTPGSITAIPQIIPSARAINFVARHVGTGVLTPDQIVIDSGRAGGALSPDFQRAEYDLAKRILPDPEVTAIAIDKKPPFVDATGRYAQIIILGTNQFGSGAQRAFVERLRNRDVPAVTFPRGTQIDVGGAAAQGEDFLTRVYGVGPWLVLVALLVAFAVLSWFFDSMLLALLAVGLDGLSVSAAYGVMVAVFHFGVASSLLGTFRVSQIEGWVPIFIFATLFGLSMDYEVFIVSRIKEARDSGAGNSDAIVTGLAHTGGVVSAAAVIMVAALGGLVFGQVAGLQELGVGLVAGVLLDATLVRGLLLPSAMALLGSRNWRTSQT